MIVSYLPIRDIPKFQRTCRHNHTHASWQIWADQHLEYILGVDEYPWSTDRIQSLINVSHAAKHESLNHFLVREWWGFIDYPLLIEHALRVGVTIHQPFLYMWISGNRKGWITLAARLGNRDLVAFVFTASPPSGDTRDAIGSCLLRGDIDMAEFISALPIRGRKTNRSWYGDVLYDVADAKIARKVMKWLKTNQVHSGAFHVDGLTKNRKRIAAEEWEGSLYECRRCRRWVLKYGEHIRLCRSECYPCETHDWFKVDPHCVS